MSWSNPVGWVIHSPSILQVLTMPGARCALRAAPRLCAQRPTPSLWGRHRGSVPLITCNTTSILYIYINALWYMLNIQYIYLDTIHYTYLDTILLWSVVYYWFICCLPFTILGKRWFALRCVPLPEELPWLDGNLVVYHSAGEAPNIELLPHAVATDDT